MNLVDEARASLPKLEEISREATRLHYAFNGHDAALTRNDEAEKLKLTQAAEEAAYGEELIEICKHLEMGGTIEDRPDDNTDDAGVNLNVQGELVRAWDCDQAALLAGRIEVLEKVCSPLYLPFTYWLTILRQYTHLSNTSNLSFPNFAHPYPIRTSAYVRQKH
jgi:hypothetical protein